MKWLKLGTNIAAIVAALVAFFTLLQVKQQTTFANSADLVSVVKKDAFKLSYKNGAAFEKIEFLSTDSLSDEIQLAIVNVGLGVSKEIQLNWLLNYENLTGDLEIGNKTIPSNSTITAENKMIQVEKSIVFDEAFEQIDFILPINQEKKETLIEIPNGYLNLWKNAISKILDSCEELDSCEIKIKSFLNKNFKLFYSLEYFDNLNNHYHKKFAVMLIPKFINIRSREVNFEIIVTENYLNINHSKFDIVLFDASTNMLKNIKI